MKGFASARGGNGVSRVERQMGRSGAAGESSPANQKAAWKLLPDVWALIKPRRGILALGFVLMLINRVSGLVLPASGKYLFDDIIIKRHTYLLPPLVLAL